MEERAYLNKNTRIVKIFSPKEEFKKLLDNNYAIFQECIINEKYATVFMFEMEEDFIEKVARHYRSLKFETLDNDIFYILRDVR